MKSFAILPVLAMLSVHCGKKGDKGNSAQQPKIAYAVYQMGLYDTPDLKKAAEWLNRAEMVTVLETQAVADKKDPKKTHNVAKIERTTGKQGYVDGSRLESKAFVVLKPTEILTINQPSGRRVVTAPTGKVGFIVEEKDGWAKVRFGYHVYENWDFKDENKKWADQKWLTPESISYDALAVAQGIDLEDALKKFNESDEKKKAQGKKELEAIVKEAKSQFIAVAEAALAAGGEKSKEEKTEKVETPEKKDESATKEGTP